MISLLIYLLVLLIVIYSGSPRESITRWTTYIRKVVYLIVGLIALLLILSNLGLVGGNVGGFNGPVLR